MSHYYKKKKSKNLKLFLLASIELGIIAFLLFLLLLPQKTYRKVTIEAGSVAPDISKFIKGNNEGKFVTDISKINLKEIGSHTIKISVEGKIYKSILSIEDTISPKASDGKKTGALGVKLNALSCVKDVEDATKVTAQFEQEPDWMKSGTQNATVIIRDEADNEAKVVVTIQLVKDKEPPVIKGVVDQAILVNGVISFKKGITVTDNQDKEPSLTVDASKVNLRKEGSYVVIYTAKDQAGNKTTAKATISVIGQNSLDKKLISIPSICQYPLLPTGCEIVAATMVLQFYADAITPEKFAREWIECSDRFYYLNNIKYGPDPNAVFVGNPFTVYSYGCFATPILNAINNYSQICSATNITGKSLDEICIEYINKNQPILIWATMQMREVTESGSWLLENGNKISWPAGEHCFVLVGFDKDSYFLSDPETGSVTQYKKSIVDQRYKELGSQAIYVNKK